MKKRSALLSSSAVFLSVTLAVFMAGWGPYAHADQFYRVWFDGYTYPMDYQVANGTVLDKDADDLVFHVNGTGEGELVLIVPKTVPLYYNHRHGFTMWATQDGVLVNPRISEVACDFKVAVDFNGESRIMFGQGGSLIGHTTTYLDLYDRCLDDPKYNTGIQNAIDAVECTSPGHKKYLNMRERAVCVTDGTFHKLYDRGYLITHPILKFVR